MLMQTFLNQKLQVQESKKTFSNSKEIPKRFQECIVSDEDSLFSSSSKISYDINTLLPQELLIHCQLQNQLRMPYHHQAVLVMGNPLLEETTSV